MKQNILLIVVLGILFLTACSEKEDLINSVKPEFEFDLSDIKVEVDNNILVFENIDELNECTVFLNKIGEENFDAFEEAIGFMSYRRHNKLLINKYYPDNIIRTFMNPNNEIIVDNYLYEIIPEKDSVCVYKLEKDAYGCKFPNVSYDYILSVKDDIYSIVYEDISLKSASTGYCDFKQKKSPILNWSYEIYHLAQYDPFFLWRSFYAYISKESLGGTLFISLHTRNDITSHYEWKNGSIGSFSLHNDGGNGLFYSINLSVPRLTSFSFNVEFDVWDTYTFEQNAYWISIDCEDGVTY
ncbi:MAG: hypothetical protein K9H26_00445 [Prolixibacteraceae bacterium]|nr:hypothetical protein [Prolixibacteraceae bacterium]